MRFLLPILLILSQLSIAQNSVTYKKAHISLENQSLIELSKIGIALDHALIQKNYVEVVLSENEIQLVENEGYNINILNHDLSQSIVNGDNTSNKNGSFIHCDELFNDSVTVPMQFNYGSMANFLTYDEILLELDSMAINYPNLISVKQPIDTFLTYEGRPIYFVKLSDNPNSDESGTESQLLYNALHHAREPMSMMQLIFYMEYLLENYNSNQKVKHIVDNLELFFVPCINPDGYVYNETTNPSGGGFWRKNRRDNLDGNFGVDLNRNYGYNWGINDIGSSPSTSSFTYRGTSAFSEPETRAMKYLCEANDFKATLNYHAYSNLLLLPEGYKQDSARFINFSEHLTAHNHYTYGTGEETLGYSVNGDSDAWMYNDVTDKGKQYSFTPEIGNNSDNFWPPLDRIVPLCKENLLANINTALIVGDYVDVSETSNYSTEKIGILELDIQRFGLDDVINGTIRIKPNGFLKSIDAQISLGSFADLEKKSIQFNYVIADDVLESTLIPFELELDLDGVMSISKVYKLYSTQPAIYSEKFDLNLSDWNLNLWGNTTEHYVSQPFSITDSPFDDYQANLDNELILNKTINFTNPEYKAAYLRFNARWETENGYDYVQIKVDDGVEEKAMCGNFTNVGVGFTGQPDGEPLYDGIQREWVEEYVNLDDYLGKVFDIKFVMKTDGAFEMDGFYLDNFRIYAVKELENGVLEEFEIGGNELEIYPNPTNNLIHIVTENAFNTKVQIINILGEIIDLDYSTLNNQIVADVSSLETGIYNISIIQNGELLSQTNFVKE